jgi:hypothetical protein
MRAILTDGASALDKQTAEVVAKSSVRRSRSGCLLADEYYGRLISAKPRHAVCCAEPHPHSTAD